MESKTLFLLVSLAALGCAFAQIEQVILPYPWDALEPAIDTNTMIRHYGIHYSGYVNITNAALRNATGLQNNSNLTDLITSLPTLGAPLNTTIRNQGGGAWNHALYFKHLAPPNSTATQQSALSPALRTDITTSFGSVNNLITNMTATAIKVFGSGWAWLCYTGGATPLVVTTTPNQDNPLMGNLPDAPPVTAVGCTPILGIDVWEHSYYLKHGPKRAAYLADFWTVVDWQQVSKNHGSAVAGSIEELVAPDAEVAVPTDGMGTNIIESATSSAGALSGFGSFGSLAMPLAVAALVLLLMLQ